MNVKNFVVAAALFASAGAAFATESPEPSVAGNAASAFVGGSGASATASASGSDLPAPNAPAHTAREEAKVGAKAGTAGFLENYKTPLALQLDQYKN